MNLKRPSPQEGVPVQSEEKTHDEQSRASEETVPEEREHEGSTRHEDRSILAHMIESNHEARSQVKKERQLQKRRHSEKASRERKAVHSI